MATIGTAVIISTANGIVGGEPTAGTGATRIWTTAVTGDLELCRIGAAQYQAAMKGRYS